MQASSSTAAARDGGAPPPQTIIHVDTQAGSLNGIMSRSCISSGYSSPQRPGSPSLDGPAMTLEDQIRSSAEYLDFFPVPRVNSNSRLMIATPQVRTRPGSMRSQRWIIQPRARPGAEGDENLGCAAAMEDTAPPVVPLYMIMLDLAFAAAFDVCTSAMRHTETDDDNALARFFMVFLPVAWLWDHTNRFFNRFDQEDLVSEMTVITLMGGVMALALNVHSCFYLDVLPSASGKEGTCVYLAASYAGCRGVLSVLTAYVALYVPLARRLLWQELVLWLFLGPCLLLLAFPHAVPSHSSGTPRGDVKMRSETFFVIGWAADLLISLAGELPRRCTRGVVPTGATYRAIGLDGRYTIMRNERMVIIMLGSVCVNATARAFNTLDSDFTWRAGVMCAAVPWAAFLIKTWYFDLCQCVAEITSPLPGPLLHFVLCWDPRGCCLPMEPWIASRLCAGSTSTCPPSAGTRPRSRLGAPRAGRCSTCPSSGASVGCPSASSRCSSARPPHLRAAKPTLATHTAEAPTRTHRLRTPSSPTRSSSRPLRQPPQAKVA